MRYEHDRLPGTLELRDLREALVLEIFVTDGEHLVDQEHVGLEMDRDREAQAHVHAARIRLNRRVEEPVQPREGLDRWHQAVHLSA